MPGDKWLDYAGQTTDELIALEASCRIDSLVVAFEMAIQQKETDAISREERIILAIEALEREVNNGGYSQFFLNSSREFVDIVVDALLAIDCPKTAAITRDAIDALGVGSVLTGEQAEAVVLAEDETVMAALGECDNRYFTNDEPIADQLFAWIKDNRDAIKVG